MYSCLNASIKEFVLKKYDESIWNKISLNLQNKFNYETECLDDRITDNFILTTASALNLKKEQFLEHFGEFYLSLTRNQHYEKLIRNLGTNVLNFLQNVDSLHSYAKCRFFNMNMPSFCCGDESSNEFIVLHYYSFRKGLYHIVVGLIKCIARTYFKKEALFSLISINDENVCDQNGYREHVIWNVTLKNIKEAPKATRPRFVAETEKHCEKVIRKTQLEIIKKKIEAASTIKVTRKQAVKSKWKAIAKFALLNKGGKTGFSYPAETYMNSKLFCEIFPFHFIFDDSLSLKQAGFGLQNYMPDLKQGGICISKFFTLIHPSNVDFNWNNALKFIQTPHVLKCNKSSLFNWKDRPDFYLRGQIIHMKTFNLIMFLGSPLVRSLNELEERLMKFSEIPLHDVTRDIILMKSSMDLNIIFDSSKDKAEKVNGEKLPSLMDENKPQVKVLKTMYDGLKSQKENTNDQDIKYAFLPQTIRDLVRNGKSYTAELHHNVTVLFSDICSFNEYSKKVEPSEWIQTINEIYLEYNKLANLHNLFQVEVVGDAYMLVSGIYEEPNGGTERIIKMALVMQNTIKKVKSPITTNPLQIRIGIHRGSVICGIIKTNSMFDRLMVMGETCSFASKMEASGLPGRIHVTRDVFERVSGADYCKIEERKPFVQIRGFGLIKTYFIKPNEENPV